MLNFGAEILIKVTKVDRGKAFVYGLHKPILNLGGGELFTYHILKDKYVRKC